MPEPIRSTDADTDLRLDAAIACYPLAPLPAGFVERAMARIEAEAPVTRAVVATPAAPPVAAPARLPATVPAIRFRLQFLDLMLPILFAGLACLGLVLVVWSMDSINPLWAAETELDLRLAWQTAQLYLPQIAFGVLLLVCGVVAALGLGALMLMVLDQPFAAAASTRPAPTSPSIARTSPTQ